MELGFIAIEIKYIVMNSIRIAMFWYAAAEGSAGPVQRLIHCGSICGALIAGSSPRLLGQMSRSTCWSYENGIICYVGPQGVYFSMLTSYAYHEINYAYIIVSLWLASSL
jgi:hypothetical protein